ncbi:hypothetical protein NLU13_4155 [Sarocladium strictum]|uniref:Rad21/Rec8-like protein N-terminal domain-containing protein n=1 Tax=Sarocladium strictum TaxID=5046 RepID=A0AA39GIC1_SARSR|nr:hypothetical protein NLU13_4155 [Sarocladium strictum]
MFYSHEILSNSQYGVATIWLVATVGKGANRKVTRKAIQEVNVPKACEIIIEPGAPLALRLQGNLLYGTTRVFAQQCGYVLADAEKTQSDMRTFFRIVQTSEVDPAAGKTRRQDIVLPDDPSFDPLAPLPSLDLLNSTDEPIYSYSQASGTKYSQFSPLDQSLADSTPRSQPSAGGIAMSSSSHSTGAYCLPSDLLHKDASNANCGLDFDPMADLNVFSDGQGDEVPVALRFDEFGNLIGIDEDENEPELPALPGLSSRPPTAGGPETPTRIQGSNTFATGNDDMMLFEEPPLADAEAFAVEKPAAASESLTTESIETGRAIARNKQASRRKAKPVMMLDEVDKISRDEFKNWSRDYIEHMEALRTQRKMPTTAEARKNALAFVIGNGVEDIGNDKKFGGVVHPLASYFAGYTLQSLLQGREPDSEPEMEQRGRKRSSQEALDYDEERGRHLKKGKGADDDAVRDLHDDNGDSLMLEDDTAPEVGMEPMSAMAERHSSSRMPWSRPGSAVPGSSIRGQSSAQKMTTAPSPLLGRHRIPSDFDRQSDSVVHLSDDVDHFHLVGRSSTPKSPTELLCDMQIGAGFEGPAALDNASQEFLGYMRDRIEETSTDHNLLEAGREHKHWVDFEDLADPATHSKAVAAQAFLHVLSLATKNVVDVQQDCGDGFTPFGPIRVGMTIKLAEDADSMNGAQIDE